MSMKRKDNINNNGGKWANKKKKDRDEFPMLPYFLPDYLYLYKSVYIGCEGERGSCQCTRDQYQPYARSLLSKEREASREEKKKKTRATVL